MHTPITIAPGSLLGPYEIIAPIGAGGMGEVFKARDTRLERNVAIKILPPEFAQNAQFKARFEREAKTISQLNHPHICAVHDVGHVNGVDYLIRPLTMKLALFPTMMFGKAARRREERPMVESPPGSAILPTECAQTVCSNTALYGLDRSRDTLTRSSRW